MKLILSIFAIALPVSVGLFIMLASMAQFTATDWKWFIGIVLAMAALIAIGVSGLLYILRLKATQQ